MSPTRLDTLLADPEGIFRNGWEDGRVESEGQAPYRAQAEWDLGYAATVGKGVKASTARDLPNYVALLYSSRPEGVRHYGEIVFVWNADLRARSTFTPNDSMDWYIRRDLYRNRDQYLNNADLSTCVPKPIMNLLKLNRSDFLMLEEDGARSATGPDHLYPLLAYGHADSVRDAFARATEFRYDREWGAILASGASPGKYFEGQIHGDLLWSDLDEIRVCHAPGGQDAAARHRDRIKAYAQQRGLDLPVQLHLIDNARERDRDQRGRQIALANQAARDARRSASRESSNER